MHFVLLPALSASPYLFTYCNNVLIKPSPLHCCIWVAQLFLTEILITIAAKQKSKNSGKKAEDNDIKADRKPESSANNR